MELDHIKSRPHLSVGARVDSAESVRNQLERILGSTGFARSERLSRFLRFTVDQVLEDKGDQIKEYLIGVEVFDRPTDFDPRVDSIVRVEAVRLRSKLKEYYATEGRNDAIIIEIAKGSYVPAFRPQAPLAPEQKQHRAVPTSKGWAWVALVAVALAVVAGFLWWPARGRPGPPAEGELSSIVVLPFVNLSAEQQDEYFSDGLTEDLINALAKVDGLRVVASTSSFAFKGKPHDVREIGARLKVQAVLEGTVRKAGDRLRITAQLMSAADGYHLWSGTYDRQMADLFAVQDEVSQAIIKSMRIKLAGNGRQPANRPTNSEAYDLYLLGRSYRNKTMAEVAREGIDYLEQALKADPSYAPAYATLADSYLALGLSNMLAPEKEYSRAEAAAVKALELDATLAEAHLTLASVRALRWDWSGAGKEFQQVFHLDPTRGHAAYATLYLAPMGRLDEAIREMKKALDQDPLSLASNQDLGKLYYFARRYEEAIRQFRRILETDPNSWQARWDLGRTYLQQGMFEEAVARFRPETRRPGELLNLALTHAMSGRILEAERLLAELEEPHRQGKLQAASNPEHFLQMARGYAVLGHKDQAFACLETAYEQRNHRLVELKIDPLFDRLRSDPRYADLLGHIGLAP